MAEGRSKTGTITFQTEGRLLQELGERLVASPEVALVELIKNSYDADASLCEVRLSANKRSLIIQDTGTGMTFDDFESRWMRIATSHKIEERFSSKYQRRLTGQKGIGRFAVRFLGAGLRLDTVAWDKKFRSKTRLVANFEWEQIDKEADLGNAKIPYTLSDVANTEALGTKLIILKLKTPPEFVGSRSFRTSVLRIVSPVTGLKRGRFEQSTESRDRDPGFNVVLPGQNSSDSGSLDIAKKVLDYAWAKLLIDLRSDSLSYRVTFMDGSKRHLRLPLQSSISSGLFADIRFFPRRKGVFRSKEIDGKAAWRWVRDNCGVGVVDHGFRIKPYGFLDDDWLSVDADNAHNQRDWRSKLALNHFPISPETKARPGDNPALNLPANFQLVGAVFVESAPPAISKSGVDLTPSMDREGFLKNAAFDQLVEVVRAGIEFLAAEDKKSLQKQAEETARTAARSVRQDFRSAIRAIQSSTTLTRADKARLINHYSVLAEKLESVEAYDREARSKLETMSLLGVVAGFMTHEATSIVANLEELIEELRPLAKKNPSLAKTLKTVGDSYDTFRGHMDYTAAFIDALQADQKMAPFKAAAQVRRIIDKFGHFAKNRGIVVESEIESSLEAPAISLPVYSGALLNLYTNALKAILASDSSQRQPRIVFRAWNDSKWHTIEVLDTGIGVPAEIQARIFDPMFTTTSRLNNPLGSGMGLGLSLVKQLITQIGGKIRLVNAPNGFSTCFRLDFPRT